MKKVFIIPAILAAALALGACTDPAGATRALKQQGYTEIEIRKPGWFGNGCGEHDTYATPFHAKSIAGVWVDGVVCASGNKGNTIRTF